MIPVKGPAGCHDHYDGTTEPDREVAEQNLARDLAERINAEFEKSGFKGTVNLEPELSSRVLSDAWKLFHESSMAKEIELVMIPDFVAGNMQVHFRPRERI